MATAAGFEDYKAEDWAGLKEGKIPSDVSDETIRRLAKHTSAIGEPYSPAAHRALQDELKQRGLRY